jgi:hypothetical protein
MGIGYRWSCDLAGPFESSKVRGNEYVMVMIDHFSKYAELAAIPAKEPEHTAFAFATRVLGCHGCPGEVLTDRGLEWASVFAAQLQQHAIDHRLTSPLHPQADGLTERLVQTVKRSLQKMARERSDVSQWDTLLPSLQLAYNSSTQAATGFAPYLLMHGQPPMLPPATRDKFDGALVLDAAADVDLVSDLLVQRQQLMEDRLILARSNLEVAQHRMTLRYARLRDGTYAPGITNFCSGDYVYLRTGTGHSPSLQINVRPVVLRVKEVRDSGVLLLEGRDGRTCTRHATTCSPCHLPNIDPEQDLSEAPIGDIACQLCGSTQDEAVMIICDWCATGWHTFCLEPPLADVPAGDWLCPTCSGQGISQQQLNAKRAVTEQLLQQQQQAAGTERRMFPSALQRRQDAQRQLLSGRRIFKTNPALFKGPGAPVQGVVRYLGPGVPASFVIEYDDGTEERLSNRQMGHRHKWLLPTAAAAVTSAAAIVNAAAEGGKSPTPTASSSSAGCSSQVPDQHAADASSSIPGEQQVDYGVTYDVQQTLSRLMPGAHSYSALRAVVMAYREVAQNAACTVSAIGRTEASKAVLTADFAGLLGYVDFSMCRVVADPLPGVSDLEAAAASQGLVVQQATSIPYTIADACMDSSSSSQDSSLLHERQLQALHADVLCSAPPTGLLDLVVPLFTFHAALAAVVWVPVSWIGNPSEPRLRYLKNLAAAGRLATITGALRYEGARRGAWLVICSSEQVRDRMLTKLQGATHAQLV